MNRRLAQRCLLPLLLVALSAVAVGCGSGSGDGTDANKLLRETFAANKEIESGNLALSLDLSGRVRGLEQLLPLKAELSGPFQTLGAKRLPKFDLALSVGAAGRNLRMGIVSTGSKGFIQVMGQPYVVPNQLFTAFKQGFEQAQADSAEGKDGRLTLKALGIDPLRWLKDSEVVGAEKVEGVETDHIRADVDIPRLIDDVDRLARKAGQLAQSQGASQGDLGSLSRGLTSADKKSLRESLKDVSVDIYTGSEDSTLRKLQLNLKAQDKTTKDSVDMSFVLKLSGLNEPQTVKTPAKAKPLSELVSAIERLLGGSGTNLLGLGGGENEDSGENNDFPPPPSSNNLDRYQSCVERAGSDLKKLQKCAELLKN